MSYSLKGKPHYRRTEQVYALLNQAPPFATYDRLIEYVRQSTGKGCSRKLISKWKKECLTIQHKSCTVENKIEELPSGSNQVLPNAKSNLHSQDKQQLTDKRLQATENLTDNQPQVSEKITDNRSCVTENLTDNQPQMTGDLIQNTELKCSEIQNSEFRIHNSLWSYVAATAIVVGLAGCGWFFFQDNSQPVTAQTTLIQNSELKIQNSPSRIQNGQPRTIKINLTLTNPQDLKVKLGDEVTQGTVLSDRTTERQRLLSQKKQLQLSLKKLDLPIPPITSPEPISKLGKLPPVSYQKAEIEGSCNEGQSILMY